MRHGLFKKFQILAAVGLIVLAVPAISLAGKTITHPTKEFLVLKADIEMDSNNNGNVAADDDAVELDDPGKLIYLNQDDDNQNNTEDRTENAAAVAGENDLQPLNISYHKPASIANAKLVLSAPTGNANIRVWTGPTKGAATDQVALPKTWVLGTDAVPATLHVEGAASGAVVLKLAYLINDNEVTKDELKAGVVDIDFAERADTAYGYDNGTVDDNLVPTSADNPPQRYDWVSVDANNKITDVDAAITPAAYAQYVYFVSNDPAKATVAPAQAAGTPQKLTITGKAAGKPYVETRLGTLSGALGNRLNIGVYALKDSAANFYRVKTTTITPAAQTAVDLQNGANGYLRRGVASVTLTDQGEKTIEYDINGDGFLNVNNSKAPGDDGTGGPEWTTMTVQLGAPAGRKLVHVKALKFQNPDGSWPAGGLAGFAWGDWLVTTDGAVDKRRNVAHEVGHWLNLKDTGPPGKNQWNIMYYASNAFQNFFGYFKVEQVETGSGTGLGTYEIQWDTITR